MANKQIVFTMKVMNGGGAERVISILTDAFVERDYDVTLIITHQSLKDAKLENVSSLVNVISLEDCISKDYTVTNKVKMVSARFAAKVFGRFRDKNGYKYSIKKYKIRNYSKVRYLKEYFAEHSNAKVVSFLYDAIYLTLLSVKKSNKVIISERGDPKQCLESKTNIAFFKTMFPKADNMVFQSAGVQAWYFENTLVKGTVIFNPIKSNLPKRYEGNRKLEVVTFCRLSAEKNLPLLIDAFEMLHNDYPEYTLRIYGDGNEKNKLLKYVLEKQMNGFVFFMPFANDIHTKIIDSAMFVSSSDYEGMSNSMLEAMGIGLPTICTDCPAGGARAIIKDHDNGLLVPIKDKHALYMAMKEIVENKELAEKLSKNGIKLKDELHIDKIIKQWIDVIN